MHLVHMEGNIMEELSKTSETLLKEIIDTEANVEYWNEYFDDVFFTSGEKKYKNEQNLRSAFEELKDNDFINIQWADNKPFFLSLNAKAYSYISCKERKIVNWFSDNVIAIISLIISVIALLK